MSLSELEPSHLAAIAQAIRQHRLEPDFPAWKVGLGYPPEQARIAAEALSDAHEQGANLAGIAFALEALAAEKREAIERERRRVQAVWSGPDGADAPRRDTNVVLRELFRMAEREVLIASYAFYDGQALFAPLHERMQVRPDLKVRLFIHVGPDAQMPQESREARLQRFAEHFWQHHWPWRPRPEIYYDPRAFETNSAVIHAKLAIVDRRLALVTSANFTPNAQTRNIEAGVRLDDDVLCRRFADGLLGLAKNGTLLRLDL